MDDLKIFWNNYVEIYDAYCQKTFSLKFVLLWTINNFISYGNICCCIVKVYYACPICEEGTSSKSLKHSRKMPFTSYRRFLPRHLLDRKQEMNFNGKFELYMTLKKLGLVENL